MLTKIPKKHALGISLLFALLCMGFALGNHRTMVFGYPCSYGLLLHAGFFAGLHRVIMQHGLRYASRLWVTMVCVFLAFVALAWVLLACLPQAASSLPVGLWECEFPTHVALAWLFLSMIRIALPRFCSTKGPCLRWLRTISFVLLGSILYVLGMPLTDFARQALIFMLIHALVSFALGMWKGKALSEMEEEALRVQKSWAFQGLMLCFCGASLFANILVVKHVRFFDTPVTLSLFIYAVTFVCTDVLAELYGYAHTVCIVWSVWLVQGVVFLLLCLARLLPMAEDVGKVALFHASFDFVTATVVASMVAYLFAQCLDVYVFAYLRRRTGGSYLWLRNNVATILSQGVDSLVFAGVAWGLWYLFPHQHETFSGDVWWKLTWHEYGWQSIVALCDTPFVYLIIAVLRRHVGYAYSRERFS